MFLYWIVLEENNSEDWVRCRWFTGEASGDNAYVEVENSEKRIRLTGETADDFWNELFLALRKDKKIVYVQADSDEVEEVSAA